MPSGVMAQIRTERHGLPWRAEDFNEVRLAKEADPDRLPRYWKHEGLGVPLVVTRRREQVQHFLGKSVPFSVTAVIRPVARPGTAVSPGGVVGVFELYDPVRVEHVSWGAWNQELARDTSAPFALVIDELDRDNYRDFLRPGRADGEFGLRMLEPYQPGKIPVVLVHGLLSDRFTWIPMVNDLRALPAVNQRYQIWTFQYATGQPFVSSGAEMRRALRETVRALDPVGADPALQQMVLVGHSMGGLVSKLQICFSGSILWDEVASRPLNEMQADPQERAQLYEIFAFDPVPSVQRVVFIGTPHQGSFWAESLYGRMGSSLVRMPSERVSLLSNLIKKNPDVFAASLRKGIPTSVDLLKPDSPMLIGLYRLPVNASVQLHTVAGTGGTLSDGAPADGVVPVDSARHPNTASERLVAATHNDLPDHPDTIAEIVRILGVHLQEYDAIGRTAQQARFLSNGRSAGPPPTTLR
jgi:pimeloyl-ACP methyl ester carboxylesterase